VDCFQTKAAYDDGMNKALALLLTLLTLAPSAVVVFARFSGTFRLSTGV